MNQTESRPQISGFGLKMIAVITMAIDHSAASILDRMLFSTSILDASYDKWYGVYIMLRLIGRMAFPIYCFLLTEGFCYTRNRWKYAARLAVFALISEVPFDTALFNSWYDSSHNNVFFTLLSGLLCLMVIDWARKEADAGGGKAILCRFAACAVCAALMFIAANLLNTDYGAVGVLTIIAMYLLRGRRELAFLIGVVILGMGSSILEFAALLMLIPIHFYNGSRGRKVNKYLFYAFYPAHLTILALICSMMGLGI